MRYQPQGRAQIDRSNPLGAKVIEALSLNSQMAATVSGKPITCGAGGSVVGGPRGYNLRGSGAGARASVPLDLSKYSVITVAFWLYWDAYASDDAFAMEFTPNTNSAAGGFYIDPNSGFPGFAVVANGSGGNGHGTVFNRPSALAWHRYAITIDITTQTVTMSVDGGPGSLIATTNATTTGTKFANSTLYLFSRAGTGLFGTGNLEALTIYAGVLTAAEVAQDYRNPYQIFAASPDSAYFATLAAAGVPSLKSFAYSALGGAVFGGSAARTRSISRVPVGSLTMGGSGQAIRGTTRTAQGGLALAGAGGIVRSVARAAAGGLKFAGAAAMSATAQVQARVITPVGGLLLAGAAAISRATSRAVSGGITFSGHALKTAGAAGALLASLLPIFARRRRR